MSTPLALSFYIQLIWLPKKTPHFLDLIFHGRRLTQQAISFLRIMRKETPDYARHNKERYGGTGESTE